MRVSLLALRRQADNIEDATAWWGWEDSNFQPNDYQSLALSVQLGARLWDFLASEVPKVAKLCVQAPCLCKKPIEFH